MEAPLSMSGLEQAALVRDKQIGAKELLELHLSRIDALQPKLEAFVYMAFDRARKHADRIDASHATWPDPLPSFFGVPFAIKDNDAMKYAPFKVGSKAFSWVWSPIDSPAVRLMRDAGFVMVGKTTTSEFALMPVVEPDIHGPTRNPFNVAHSAGGSSGGAAAAVASGMLPIAHAADGGGSIRIPACFCHLFGFKASRGLTADFYGKFDVVGLSVGGAVTKTVEDSAALMDALCGRPVSTGADALRTRAAERAPRGLSVRVCRETNLTDIEPRIADAVEAVARTLADAGYKVEDGPPLEGELDEFLPIFGRLAANVPLVRESTVQPVTRWLRQIGRSISKDEAIAKNEALTSRVGEWFGDADLWVTPTVARFPPAVGEFDGPDAETSFRAAAKIGAFTAPFNASGQPAANIPVGVTDDGLPYGVQIVARRGEDELVYRVASELETTEVWSRARPQRL